MTTALPSPSPGQSGPQAVMQTISHMLTSSVYTRNLSLVPQTLSKSFVDNYIKSKCAASGDKHVSKGYKYFAEQYVGKIKSKYNFIYQLYLCFVEFKKYITFALCIL